MFVAEGLTGIMPIAHGLKIYGWHVMVQRVRLDWLIIGGCLYILGAGLYAVCASPLHETSLPYGILKF